MLRLDYSITDIGAEELCAAILRQAAVDIATVERARAKHGGITDEEQKKLVQAHSFLVSPWGQWLSGDNGEYIERKARETALASDQRHRIRGKYMRKKGASE